MKTLDYNDPPPPPTADSGSGQQEHGEGREGEGLKRGECTYRLEELAYLRSGDKGNSANIGTCNLPWRKCRLLYCIMEGTPRVNYSIFTPLRL